MLDEILFQDIQITNLGKSTKLIFESNDMKGTFNKVYYIFEKW